MHPAYQISTPLGTVFPLSYLLYTKHTAYTIPHNPEYSEKYLCYVSTNFIEIIATAALKATVVVIVCQR